VSYRERQNGANQVSGFGVSGLAGSIAVLSSFHFFEMCPYYVWGYKTCYKCIRDSYSAAFMPFSNSWFRSVLGQS